MQHASELTFQCDADCVPAVQWAVKRTDGRFVSNPAPWMGKIDRMTVVVGHDDSAGFTALWREIDRITKPIPIEMPKPQNWLQRTIRKITH